VNASGRMRAIAVILVLGAVGVGGTFASPWLGHGNRADTIALPTSSWHGGVSMQGLARGVLRGSPSLDGGCVWMEPPSGGRTAVVWPKDFYARFNPTRIYNGAGILEAVEGQLIEVGGGVLPARESRCMFGEEEPFNIQSDITVVDQGSE
jgi:hypothetical protein